MSKWLCTAVAAAILGSSAASAQSQPLAIAVDPATTVMSRQWTLTSSVNGRTYRIQLSLPAAPPPPGGYPVVYVTDGAAFFGTFTDAIRVRSVGREVEPAVVVGIGYPEDDFGVQLRRRTLDLTPVESEADGKALAAGSPVPLKFGGADAFLKVIRTEIMPWVASQAKVDPARGILYGHSLGGLFALHVLFNHPEAFRTYLISSPSIWWHARDVLNGEAAFAGKVAAGRAVPRIFISVGGEEQSAPPPPYPQGMTRETVAKMISGSAMIDNARALAARLLALKGAPGYRVESKIFAGESHTSVPFAALNALAGFALPIDRE